MRLLLDDTYPPALAQALRAAGINAATIIELGMSGTSDPEVFALAVSENYVVLTENVADFVTIAAEHSTTGAHHPGVLIALSSRFSRRASGRVALVKAIRAHTSDELTEPDRLPHRSIRLRVPQGKRQQGRSASTTTRAARLGLRLQICIADRASGARGGRRPGKVLVRG